MASIYIIKSKTSGKVYIGQTNSTAGKRWKKHLVELRRREGCRALYSAIKKYGVNDFRALYTFYYPGFNLRATDLQAFIGINQLKKIDKIIKQRNKNYRYYQRNIIKKGWKIKPQKYSYVSNFCYPIITENIDKLSKALIDNNIECRPLICGSIQEHPFWYERYGKKDLPMAKKVHEYGLYIPNHPKLTKDELDRIIKIVNENI